ncbi:MAG: hypothetical protein AAF337_14945 [Pseudomonadota bacterium]
MSESNPSEQKMKNNSNAWLVVTVAGVIIAMVCGFYLGQSTQKSAMTEQAALQAQFDEMQRTLPLRLAARLAYIYRPAAFISKPAKSFFDPSKHRFN